ncbi:histidine kinase [Chloroflexus islandicus]|uniref:histidine kinase n=2 Tax=Chloroflexus islandicus TaxID=1707952 RepID=A0A178MGR2_9CHLR|nr:histidine kinase [Chloroflexus islandicus]
MLVMTITNHPPDPPTGKAETLSPTATILALSKAVLSSLDLPDVLQQVLIATRALSGADVVTIWLLDEQGEWLTSAAILGLEDRPEHERIFRLRVGEGVAGWAVANRQMLHLVNPVHDPRYLPKLDRHPDVILAIPLIVRDRCFGALSLSRFTISEPFSNGVLDTIAIFADLAAIAIDNATAAQMLRRATARERILAYSAEIYQAESLIMRELADVLGAEPRLITTTPDEHLLDQADQAVTVHELDLLRNEGALMVDLRFDGLPAWLVVHAPGRYWRKEDADLLAFAASQMMRARQRAFERRAHARAEALSNLVALTNARIDQASVLDQILIELQRFVNFDSACVFVVHDEEYVRLIAQRGLRSKADQITLYAGPGSLINDLRRLGTAIYHPDVQRVPGWQKVPDSDIIRSWIGVPLRVDQTTIGVLTIDKWTPNGFTAEDVGAAQMFGEQVAAVINNVRLLREAQERARQFQVLQRFSARIGTLRNVDQLLDEASQLLHRSFGYYQVLIGVIEGEQIIVHAAHGHLMQGQSQPHLFPPLSITTGISGWVISHARPAIVNDVMRDERYVHHPSLPATAAEMIVPIVVDEQVFGIIIIESAVKGIFGQSDLDLVTAMAHLIGVTIANLNHDAELQRAREQLIERDRLRALGELSSGVAHDFNNLLASILGHVQLLLAEVDDPRLREGLRAIEIAALDGATTVSRLQGFAQTSRSTPNSPVDLNQVVTESLALTRPRWRDEAQSRGIAIDVRTETSPLPIIAGDAAALRELVINLVLNAIDAMPNGGAITVRTAPAPSDILGEAAVMLEIQDTGIGIDPALHEQIFAPFFSTKGSRGTGMGLALARGIVQQHSGRITLESDLGKGATFRIWLPVRHPPPVEQPAQPSVTPPTCCILVVDDEDAVRKVLVRILKRFGHHVDEAASGEAALAQFAVGRYHIVCTDLGMPSMSGWELAAHIRQIDPNVRIVLVTGWSEQIDPAEVRSRQIDAILAKPFTIQQVQAVIASVLASG